MTLAMRTPERSERHLLREFAPRGHQREASTLLVMALSALSLIAVPSLGVWLSRGLAGKAAKYLDAASVDEAHRRCAQLAGSVPPLSAENCGFLSSARLIEHGYIASVALLVAVLLSFWVASLTLRHSRAKLSRLVPAAIRACLAAVVLTFLVQGALFLWLSWERAVAGHGSGLSGLLFGAGLIITSFTMIWSWRELLEEVPIPVTGILVDPGKLREVWERIEHVAERLQTPPPRRLIVGLEPTAYVTMAALDLQGTGVLPATETLYLPLSGIRLWSDRELDAVIGHELGHCLGEDLLYTKQLAPAIHSFALSLESLEAKREWVSFVSLATLPAILTLQGMLWLFLTAVSSNARERELAADRAAVSVSGGEALLGAIAKLSFLNIEWLRFSSALERFVAQGRTRANFVQDFVTVMNLFRRAADPSRLTTTLLASAQPHPFDTHPPLAARAAAFSLVAGPILRRSLAAINDFHVPSKAMRELEESLTRVIAEGMRKSAGDLELDPDPSIPVELAWPR